MTVALDDMKCALVALVGVPNAGKSTLMNAIVGEKVGITSNKPNTTRVTVRGVVTDGATQLVFMDTPGLNKSSKSFDRRLVQQAQGALAEADVVVFVIGSDFAKKPNGMAQEKELITAAKGRKQKVVVALTKIDKFKAKDALLPVLVEMSGWGVDVVVPVTAIRGEVKGSGVDRLKAELLKMAPEGMWLFPEGQVTDMPQKLRLSELTREQAMRLLHQELPYTIGVVTELAEEVEEGLMLVRQQLLIAREQHKPMVLGSGGQMVKKIGTQARMEMQKMLGCGVRLELHVKVAPAWLEREDWLREMGI